MLQEDGIHAQKKLQIEHLKAEELTKPEMACLEIHLSAFAYTSAYSVSLGKAEGI